MRYLIVFFKKYITKYCEEINSDKDSNAQGSSIFEPIKMATSSNREVHVEIVASKQDITPSVLENIVCQYLGKFLVCVVDVASRKEDNRPRRKKIIHALISNMTTKLKLFIDNVISKILKGDRLLVDAANNDRILLQRFSSRKFLPTTTSRLVGEFQQVQYGASFLSKDSKVYYGKEASIPIVAGTSRNHKLKSFMHISMKDESNERGRKWENNVNFIEHLFLNIKKQVQILQGELDLLRDIFSVMHKDHNWDGQAEEVIDEKTEFRRIRETNMLLKKGDDNEEYSFNLTNFLLHYKEEDYSDYPDLKGLHEHSALSVKLRILGICFEEIIAHVVRLRRKNI